MIEKRDRHPSASTSDSDASFAVKLAAPNPQGKGLVGILEDWRKSQPRSVVAKRPAQLLADYFTTLLVLSSSFRFRPVRERIYYLYFIDQSWNLSLVAPEEWKSEARTEAFVGACVLHEDATWSITPSDNLGKPGPVADALAEAHQGFIERLGSAPDLEDSLPGYEGQLPYYQRLLVAALGRSIAGSIRAGGLQGRGIGEWLEALPERSTRLLERFDNET